VAGNEMGDNIQEVSQIEEKKILVIERSGEEGSIWPHGGSNSSLKEI